MIEEVPNTTMFLNKKFGCNVRRNVLDAKACHCASIK